MTKTEWKMCDAPEKMVPLLPIAQLQRELRLFAVACARRNWTLLSDECRNAIQLSENFARGECSQDELDAACAAASDYVEANWTGINAPDAREFASSAAVDASSIWPRTASNVLNSTSCAASAAACDAGEKDEVNYDVAFDSALAAELTVQAELLRSLVRFPG